MVAGDGGGGGGGAQAGGGARTRNEGKEGADAGEAGVDTLAVDFGALASVLLAVCVDGGSVRLRTNSGDLRGEACSPSAVAATRLSCLYADWGGDDAKAIDYGLIGPGPIAGDYTKRAAKKAPACHVAHTLGSSHLLSGVTPADR